MLYCTLTVTGRNCSPIAVPPGPVAAPLSVSVAGPGAIASNRIAASTPVPEAPVVSAARVSVMSIRPPVACWLNTGVTPPLRMKLPCCTARTRSFAGSNVSVSVIVDSPDAFVIDSGTV
jgi:hypothetical protein